MKIFIIILIAIFITIICYELLLEVMARKIVKKYNLDLEELFEEFNKEFKNKKNESEENK